MEVRRTLQQVFSDCLRKKRSQGLPQGNDIEQEKRGLLVQENQFVLLTWIGRHSGLENFKIPEYDMEDIKRRIREAKMNVVW